MQRSRGPAFVLLLLAVGYGVAPDVAAQTPVPAAPRAESCGELGPESIAARVQQRYDSIHRLSARFSQTTQSVVMSVGAPPGAEGADSASGGRVYFAKPGRMRWEYLEPAESYVISDGAVLWIFDVAARQVTRLPVGQEVLAGAALQFLLGEGRLVEAFEVSIARCPPGHVELDLRPREPSSYERLGLTVERESGLAVETSVIDLFGNRTRIRFEGIELDQPSPRGAFEFEPPPGVEVIEVRSMDRGQ